MVSGLQRCAVAFALAALSGCGGSPGGEAPGSTPGQTPMTAALPQDATPYFPEATWRTASPEQVGIPSSVLARVDQRIAAGTWRGLSAFLVIRRGYLVRETYFSGSSRDDVHTMQSVSKSVTSLVAGIASDLGALNIDGTVVSILPEYAGASPDPRLARVSARHLLEMRSGINFYENPYSGSPLETLNNSRGDWVRIALEQPFNAEPGARWQYNSGGVIVLGAAVARATNTPFHQFARERLFAPLGITSQYWYVSPYDATVHTGGGLNLRAIDLAKISYLVLKQGEWNGRQIVSRDWLARSTAPVTPGNGSLGGVSTDYGFLWWLARINPTVSTADLNNRVIFASGNMNQFLFVVPSLDLVVVNTGATNESFGVTIDFVLSELIPALSR